MYESHGEALFYRRTDGKVVEVTSVTDTSDDHGCGFDDMEYLGEGTFSHVELRDRNTYSLWQHL